MADWLTRIRCLRIQGGFGGGTKERSDHIWGLVSHFATKLGHVEHVQIGVGFSGFDMNSMFKGLNFPKLKSLDIYGAQGQEQGKVELQSEVCREVFWHSK